MNSDTHPRGSPGVSHRGDSDGPAATVVLVADDDPAVTDDIAAVLAEEYAVRTAYDSADALASLDAAVSVVLLDPDLPGLSARHVVDRVTSETADCQVAALVASEPDISTSVYDDYLVKPVSPDELRATVDRLARRAAYRSALGEYYGLAEEYAALAPDDPERECVGNRLDDLDAQLDEVFGSLDTREAYDAALRELQPDS